jgi:membrane fusion protein (multidrug efflux system)
LLNTAAGQQATLDSALASEQGLQAQLLGAEAQLQQSQINLGYTEIHAPIDGKIGRTAVTIGNYVSTNSGVLATIVSQDPMYVVFAVSSRNALDLQRRAADKKGADAPVIRIRLPDGRLYGETGTLDFIDNTVGGNTDTITLRGNLRNPRHPDVKTGDAKTGSAARELVDGEFVTVILEDSQPIEALSVPRAAVLSDQGGDYLYVVDREDKAQQRRVQLGPASPGSVAVKSGLAEGERIIVEGIQRVRPGQPVSPGPAASPAAPGSAEGAAGPSPRS